MALRVMGAQLKPVLQHPVTAIDVLLEPDATMLRFAEASNARLLVVFPQGFALDAQHRPHITLVQCFVRTDTLEQIFAAVGEVFAHTDLSRITLQAFKTYYVPGSGVGLAGIVAHPTPELLHLQQSITAAVAPFMVETGPIESFTADHGNPALDNALIDYVSSFMNQHTGEQFSPHITTGVAPIADLERMVLEPFEPFSFSPVAAAVDQLGPFGTAARKLWHWDPSERPAHGHLHQGGMARLE